MKRNILNVNQEDADADITILHLGDDGKYVEMDARKLWGGFEIGSKRQFNFVVEANRDIENDIYMNWKCSCCAEDSCSKDSIITKLFFLQNGKNVNYFYVGPMVAGQRKQVGAIIDLVGYSMDKPQQKESVGVCIFELLEGSLSTASAREQLSINGIQINRAELSDIVNSNLLEFKQESPVAPIIQYLFLDDNLSETAIYIYDRICDHHVDGLVSLNDDMFFLLSSVDTVAQLDDRRYALYHLKNDNNTVEAASKIVVVVDDVDAQVIEDIEFLMGNMGCDIVKIISFCHSPLLNSYDNVEFILPEDMGVQLCAKPVKT